MSNKRFDKLQNNDRYFRLQKKRYERIKEPDGKSTLDFSLSFTNKEILKIQAKGRLLKAKYGVKRADVLRKVLLNLDDEELLIFLGLLKLEW